MYFTQGLEDKENEAREAEAIDIAKSFPFSNLKDSVTGEAASDKSVGGSVKDRKNALKRVS